MGDPVAYWKKISGDGEGREVLAALAEILDAGYVTVPLGRDLENNRIYVWPYFAEVPLRKLTPAQQVELLRLVPAGGRQGDDATVNIRIGGWPSVPTAPGIPSASDIDAT